MSVIAVIPARYGSSRLPAKALAEIDGVPMIVRVWRQACLARTIERVIVATDDDRIAAPVRAAGGEAIMTSPAHPSGTDRIAEVAARIEAEIYLNVQGDLPFIAPADLDALAAPMRADPSIEMATLATPIVSEAEWRNPNVVKVVCDARGDALYFSRSPIPLAARRRGAESRAPSYRRLRLSAGFSDGICRARAGRARTNREARAVARAGARPAHPGGAFRSAVA